MNLIIKQKNSTTREIIISQNKELFGIIEKVISKEQIDTSEDYKKIVFVYYKLFYNHFYAFNILFESSGESSAIVILRTMLELFIRAHYLFFIEKPNGTSINEILNTKKDSNFYKMAKALDNYKDESDRGFGYNAFQQFTKKHMKTYEKLSWFSHGRGALLETFYKNPNTIYHEDDLENWLSLARNMFIIISMLLFFSQENLNKYSDIIKKIDNFIIN